ncbi:NACHT, LRR and PYD domains-containing protein 3-like isoform X1 [Mobula birostris]|uniref:NACHT, LRR and PYD domains-containing protein 3-like isoform X1 n=1 Tax=Mobula birostris TaxID=1983395 RepID=UPI003B284A50
MATGGRLNRVRTVLRRFLPLKLLGEDDRDTGSKVPKQGRIESNVPIECGPAAAEVEQIQPRDSDVRNTDRDPGTGTSEATVCQPRDSDVRNTDRDPGTGTSEATVCQPRDSDVRNTDRDPGTGTSEATVCQLGGSLNTELSSPQQGAVTEPEFAISDLLAQGGEYQLYQLTKFYRDRLEQAIEEKVERLGWMLTKEGHFSREENEKVTELTEKGHRTESSRLFLSLVMGKGSQARQAMWESFVTWRTELPKLDRILREIQELGPDREKYMNIAQGLSELPTQLIDVQQKHKETLRAQTETLRVNTILMTEKVKVFQLVDRYAELTVISTLRDRRLVEHELLARGRDHEEWREKHLRGELEKIRIDHLFQSSYSYSSWERMKRFFTRSSSGSSAVVAGVPGIGKTTMVQKFVYDWATGKIYQQFQFVFSFKFRDLNTINCRINLRELILDQYPYFGNFLREVWKNPEGLLFIFDGLDEFKHRIDFADGRRDTELKHQCPDPEWWCEVSDIVYSLIQHKLLSGCSVLVTTRPTALDLLEKAEISVCAEILGFVGEERKDYFYRHFEDQTVAAAVFKHVKENEILYTMSYNPSYCWILALALGPFFTQRDRDPQRVPKTITQLYSYYTYNILKNHGRDIENLRDVLLRVGQMAFTGLSQKKIVFTDGDLISYNLQPSQFLSGFLMELLERENSARCVVYTFPHLTIQEFVAAVAQFLTIHPRKIRNFLTEAHNTTDGRFEVFLRFVAGLSSPMTVRGLEEFLGPFANERTCRVIDWVKEEIERQIRNTETEIGKKSLLNTLHYLFESQNRGLARTALGSVETLSFRGMTLTPIDCAVLSHAIGLCDTIKQLKLEYCHIQCEGIQRLGPGLHKCQDLRLGDNKLGDSGVQVVSAALRNQECKVLTLWLDYVGLTDSGAEHLASALSTNQSLVELNLSGNELGDSGVKLVSAALRNPECEIQKLWQVPDWEIVFTVIGCLRPNINVISNCITDKLWGFVPCPVSLRPLLLLFLSFISRLYSVGLTDSGAEDLASDLSTKRSMKVLSLASNSLTDLFVPALRRLVLNLPRLEWIRLAGNQFSETGKMELESLTELRPGLKVEL